MDPMGIIIPHLCSSSQAPVDIFWWISRGCSQLDPGRKNRAWKMSETIKNG